MSKDLVYDGDYLRVVRHGRWEFVERSRGTGVVGIVALTPANKVILVEQFRIPVNRRIIELPAGLVGDESNSSEPLEEAAIRELVEETGYTAESMEQLANCPSSAGLTSEVVTLLMARGVKRVGEGGGIEGEEIKVHEVPLEEVDGWLQEISGEQTMVDFKVYAGLYFLRQRNR